MPGGVDPRYVVARTVLLDPLGTLSIDVDRIEFRHAADGGRGDAERRFTINNDRDAASVDQRPPGRQTDSICVIDCESASGEASVQRD